MFQSADPVEDLVLVPNSGIQFLRLSLDLDAVARFDRPFIERAYDTGARRADGTPVPSWRLLAGWNPDDPSEPPDNEPEDDDHVYTINKQKALEPFLGKWVPVPFLKIRSSASGIVRETYFDGPTNWVRVRVVEDPDRAGPGSPGHIVVFAFDTTIEDYVTKETSSATSGNGTSAGTTGSGAEAGKDGASDPYIPYTEPRADDIANPRRFALVSHIRSLDRFLCDPRTEPDGTVRDYQAWIVDWLRKLFIEHLEATVAPRRLKEGDIRHALEHVARWIAFLDLLKLTLRPPRVRFVDTLTRDARAVPVDVDLILDVGNSRTCGILIEDYPNHDDLGLASAMTLRLRDVAAPEITYAEPFDSHVEFAQAWFGPHDLSRESGRENAFFWPSPVRVGPEATRLRSRQQGGNDALCGMSSPKRYLWDVAEASQPWRFPQGDHIDGVPPPIGLKIRRFVNANGDVLSRLKREQKLFTALYPGRSQADIRAGSSQFPYSRSAIYTFMLAEIIWQAFMMINSPEVRSRRSQSEVPRRLRRIILTLPTAVPTREQRIMKMRAESARDLIWDLLGWTKEPPPGTERPLVQVSWDEASCVQLVWLYGEIAGKFGGDIQGFLDLRGRPRPRFRPDEPPAPGASPESSLRVASVDIGGGTTDLMVTTYFQKDNRAIEPVQTFREGVRVAGDDVTRAVIERALLPAFEAHLRDLGVAEPRILLRRLFGGDHADITVQEMNARRQYVQRVFLPAALALLSAFEEMTPHDYATSTTHRLGDLVPRLGAVPAHTRVFLEGPAASAGAPGFRLEDVPVTVDFDLMRRAVRETLAHVVENIAEALHHFDCDMVLLSGRPTKLAAIADMFVDALAVAPDRILPMHRYRPGNWYPFRSRDDTRIDDPKTATVVGGMLLALADRRIRNFMVYTDRLQMRSTARFIGELDGNNKLTADKVRFSDSAPPAGGGEDRDVVRYYSRVIIGARQLPHERWIASPLYQLAEAKGGNAPPKPIRVRLERAEVDLADDDDAVLERESAREELKIVEALDPNGANVAGSMFLTLRTMDDTASYWLDSGILTV
ncbi:virulence factor SrfB [Methylobrevis pamukkalensis]|uniref:Virulence factor SrfB n=1 Tax=Methylobrevis pamukkalensis TaxID=1439726 RepID=A0A1E3H306_9HYPH|nr:virulence factor SrfB [Methylobrevis pamukkalensis]ODN70709.1 Virulence factor SrfB [Methylobrevis pamukkalensis]